MTVINVFIVLLPFTLGVIVGMIAVFHKLHRQFGVPLSEDIWEKLTLIGGWPRPIKLVVAGNHTQFRQWLQSNVKYISSYKDICGYNRADCELLKVGEWWKNPFVEYYDIAAVERMFHDAIH